MSDITIVTAFFDIGRGDLPKEKHGRPLPWYQHRSIDTYFEYFEKQARLNNDMVIYTTPDLVDRVVALREKYGHGDKTVVVQMPSYLPEGLEPLKEEIQRIMDLPEYIANIDNPQLIEYWHADYVLVNIFKAMYVSSAINAGHVKTPLTAWIDFGYARSDETIPTEVLDKGWKYDFDVNKIHMFNQRPVDVIEKERPISDIIKTGDVYIQGCHIVGGTEKWADFGLAVFANLRELVSHDLIDDDQTLLLLAALSHPELVELHYNSPDDWFRVFKDYNEC